MRVSCQLCLAVSWLGALVRAEWRPSGSHIDTSKLESARSLQGFNLPLVQLTESKFPRGSEMQKEDRKLYSYHKPVYYDIGKNVPNDYNLEVSRLKIPETVLSKRVNIDGDVLVDSDEGDDGTVELDESIEGEPHSEEVDSLEVDDDLKNHGDEDDDFDNQIYSNEFEDKKKPKSSTPAPHKVGHYEVTETIPFDTKMTHPQGPVYPLPPPCLGAPPPTFPTRPPPPPSPPPPPPSVKPPGTSFYSPYSVLGFPQFPKDHKYRYVKEYPPMTYIASVDDPYPLSAMSNQLQPYPQRSSLARMKPMKKPNSSKKHRPASHVIVRYPIVLRKVRPLRPGSDAVIIRHIPPARHGVYVHRHHLHRRPRPSAHRFRPAAPVRPRDKDMEQLFKENRLKELEDKIRDEWEGVTLGPFAEPYFDSS